MRLRRQIGACAKGFGQAIKLREADIHDPLGVQQQALGNRRCTIGDNLQGREVCCLHVGMLGQHHDHRRHPEGIGNGQLFREFQDEARINITQDHRLGTLRCRQHADIHAGHMEQGHRVHHRLACAIARPFQHGCLTEEGFIACIRKLNALGPPGRA